VQRLNDLTGLYRKGQLTIPVTGTFPLAEAAAAHHEVETGHVRGKVALTVD
jgi:enoyl reductase